MPSLNATEGRCFQPICKIDREDFEGELPTLLALLARGMPYSNQVLTRKVSISRPKKGQPTVFEEFELECGAGDFGVKLRRKGGTITVELQQG